MPKLSPKEQRQPTKSPYSSPVELRHAVLNRLHLPDDPKQSIATLFEKSKSKDSVKLVSENEAEKLLFSLGFENDYTLIETVSEKYRGMAIELRRQLIKDFDCKTYGEKVLVDGVVSGYMRNLQCARSFNICITNIHQGNGTTALGNNFLSVMSKEMDRANRHMLTAYQMLINLKRPPINVQVNAHKAYVAAQQQVNTVEHLVKEDAENVSTS
jgi:hypothetical protein